MKTTSSNASGNENKNTNGTRKRKQITTELDNNMTGSMMTALGATKYGSPATSILSFTQMAKPHPESLSPTEIIVRVAYSDLNPVDHHKLKRGRGIKPNVVPLVVGFGGSGTVESIHGTNADEKTKALMGKKVVFLVDPNGKSGSYAEYIVCDRRIVAVIPSIDDSNNRGTETSRCPISLREAASIPVAGCTAFESLAQVGLPVSIVCSRTTAAQTTETTGERKRLLIVGGAGGVGSWTTQLARACYPSLEIICTASSSSSSLTPASSSSEWCVQMGADRTIPHDDILANLDGGPRGSVDYIVCLAEPKSNLWKALTEVLRPYGRICLVVAGDAIKLLDLSFVFFKCGTVSTETLFSSIRDGYRLDQGGEMAMILRLMADGRVTAPLNPLLLSGNGGDGGGGEGITTMAATGTNDGVDENDGWREALREGGTIDIVGSGHCRGKLVMRIE